MRLVNFAYTLIAMLLMAAPAWAQDQDTTFRELVCRMAVGNVAGARQPMLELYGDPEATRKSGGAYGLFTGFYHGNRGWSGHGPDLDGVHAARFLSDGTQFTNADAAQLRAVTRTFRKTVCDNLPTPTPQ